MCFEPREPNFLAGHPGISAWMSRRHPRSLRKKSLCSILATLMAWYNARFRDVPLNRWEREQLVFSEEGLGVPKMSLALDQPQGCTGCSGARDIFETPRPSFETPRPSFEKTTCSLSCRFRGTSRNGALYQAIIVPIQFSSPSEAPSLSSFFLLPMSGPSISDLFVGSWHRNHCFWQMTIGCSKDCCLSQPSNGLESAPTCSRALLWPDPGISTKNAEKIPPRPKLWISKKPTQKHRKQEYQKRSLFSLVALLGVFLGYFQGIWGVNSGSPEFRAEGFIFRGDSGSGHLGSL